MKKLNKDLPYGLVSGLADHRYVQDGCKFNVQGEEVGAPQETVASPTPVVVKKTNYQLMKNDTLKELIIDNGGVWTNRKDAIKFLKGD